MIISGLQTGNTRWLAAHLQNAADNEAIDIVEVTGTVAADVDGALAEFDAIAAGTKATEGVYAAFINPPEPLSRAQFLRAIATIEGALGLTGQPRIVLFHVKKGREHCHVVWSRIDTTVMRAIHLSHDRQKLRRCAQELAAEFGLPLPQGLAQDRGSERFLDRPGPTKAEKAMQASSGLSRDQRRAALTSAYRGCDSPESFVHALEEAGYILARGERRALVVIDIAGEIHSLARQIDGARTSDVKKKLEGLNLALLPTAERAKLLMQQRAVAQHDAVRASRQRETEAKSEHARLAELQAKRRLDIDRRWQAMKIRQMHEWKVLLAHIKAQDDRRLTHRHWLAAGLAAYMKKIIFLRELVAYYERRRKKSQEEQDALFIASVRRRHENEAAELRRFYDALARRIRSEWVVFEQASAAVAGSQIASGAAISTATLQGAVKIAPFCFAYVDVTRQLLEKNTFRVNAGDITQPDEIKVTLKTEIVTLDKLARVAETRPSATPAAWGIYEHAGRISLRALPGQSDGDLSQIKIQIGITPKPIVIE